jgi:hypothetical protein
MLFIVTSLFDNFVAKPSIASSAHRDAHVSTSGHCALGLARSFSVTA